jgi:hypothetical protein
MKSFQNFVNIVERTTPGFGKPTGYDAQGEPMYTRRPGPREKGRRAKVQGTPKSVTAVKGEIEAAKGFGSVKSGGLDTRPTDPKFTAAKRDPRVAALGGNVWDDPTPASGRPFKSVARQSSTSTTLRTRTGGTSGRDWLSSLRGPESSKSDPWKGSDYKSSYELQQRMRNNPTEPFGDSGFEQPSGKPQSKPSAAPEATKPKSPEPVKQSVVSQQAKQYRASQKTVDVSAKPVGTKFAEPIPKPKGLPGLSSEPAGPLKTVRKGESQTIRPQKGPGRTGVLGAPKAGVLTGAPKIEPVKVREIKPPVTASIPSAKPAAPAKSTPATVAAPKAPKASTRTVAPRVSTSTTNAAAASAKSFRRMARVGGLFATGVTIKNVRDQALASGAGRRRADLEGLAAGIGGSLASTAAIAAATPTGPVGQAVAGTAAFQPGADFARGIVRRLAGKPGDAVTKKSVLKNIKSTYRDVVPQSVRQNVPDVAKKGFTDFYNQAVPFANKLYKGYRRFKRVSDLTGGDKK